MHRTAGGRATARRLRRAVPAVLVALAVTLPAAGPAVAAVDRTPPVVNGPAAVPRAGGTVNAASIPFRVTWSGTDTGSGIALYRLEVSVDGGSWASVSLPSATARAVTVGLRPPHDARFRVRARDRAGNTSAWRYGTAFRVRRLPESAAGVTKTGPWTAVTATGFLGDRALRSRAAGASISVAFTGRQVTWFGRRSRNGGSARVYLDGVYRSTVSLHATTTADRRIQVVAGWPASGTHVMTIRVVGTAGHPDVVVDGFVVVDTPPADPVLLGAGDIATCGLPGARKTAALLDGIAGRVFAAGDEAYPAGTVAQFRNCYGPTWGRWRLRTSPVPGNHEYTTSGAGAYYAYFGARAGTRGRGWYAYDLGTWRIYNLNANCSKVGCGPGSAQVAWLRDDLAAHPRACVAAIWHQPLFSSGAHGNSPLVRPLWDTLAAAGADVVINGHDHDYERFAPQTGAGRADPAGIREFVVGTGGAPTRPFAVIRANSVVRNRSTFGVLRLTLHPGAYDWRFVPVAGTTFTDTGTGSCH